MASPRATNSLSGSKALIIDTTAPTVSSVTSTTANATKKTGDAIAITIAINEAVAVSGTPQLTLETGSSDAVVNYSSRSVGQPSFTAHTINGSFNGAHSVFATDVDGDGDVDVLGTAHLADDITWWENNGSEERNTTRLNASNTVSG